MTNQVCNTVMLPVEEYEALRRERDALQNMVLDTGGQLAAMTQERDAAKAIVFELAQDAFKHNEQLAAMKDDARLNGDFATKAFAQRDHLLHELEAAQAQIAQLREALESINNTIYAQGVRVGSDDYFRVRERCCEALALPTDHAALDARLKEERERCASVCDIWDVPSVAKKIRSLT
jgi:hypothetical protein